MFARYLLLLHSSAICLFMLRLWMSNKGGMPWWFPPCSSKTASPHVITIDSSHKNTQIADKQMWNLIRDSKHPSVTPRKCSLASKISIKNCRARQISSAPPALGGAISGVRGFRSPINVSHQQCEVTWSTSTARMDTKLSWLNHQNKIKICVLKNLFFWWKVKGTRSSCVLKLGAINHNSQDAF